MTRTRLRRSHLLAGIPIAVTAILLLGRGPLVADAAPAYALSLGLIPSSGPPGMSVSAVGSDWTMSNAPYVIFWDVQGGTQLGTFSPDSSGNWSTPITIPGGAGAGGHTVWACEGYGGEFQGCASASFTVAVPSSTPTATRTRTPTPTPVPGVTVIVPSATITPTSPYAGGCIDGINDISPNMWENLGGVDTHDLVFEVVGDLTTRHALIHLAADDRVIYTQWPDPYPGTVVEAVPDATESNRWRITVRDYPVRRGYNQIHIELSPTCSRLGGAYFQFSNGIAYTPTPRPDACGGLGFGPEATIINFDWSGAAAYLARIEAETGVRFEGSVALLDPPEVNPRSGFQAGASVEGLEFGSVMLPIRMAFDRPVSAVGLYAGMLPPYSVTGDVRASLGAYGYHGADTELVLLGSDSVSFPAAPTDIIHCLQFTAAEGDFIARALVEYTDSSSGSIAERRLIDDVTLLYSEAELPPDRPPVVEITAPGDGSSIPGPTVFLRASIQEDRELADVRFQIDGGAETLMGAAPSLTDPSRYTTGANFSTSLMEAGTTHLLTVSARDVAGQFAVDTVQILVPTPIPSLDLQAVKMEVVQVVQCLDNSGCSDNAVPMVINKPTWVRVYVRAENGPPARPVSGRLCQGRVTTCDTGYVVPFNEIVPNDDEDPTATDRGALDASLNFFVPPVWLTEGTLELTAFVNYQERDVDETRSDNNAVQASVSVVPARALTVMFMPVTASGLTPPISEMWALVDWLSRVFPVARIVPVGRAPLRGDFDLSDSSGDGCGRTWGRLMDALRGAYTWSGRGSAYLFGMVPEGVDTDGIGGCGETPGRVASGIVTPGWRAGPTIAAQELGHNFGRRHAAGCRATGNDDGYPRRRGLLDDWGIDLALRQTYAPNNSFDYMGYCGGADDTWTSVYTYLALLRILPVAETQSPGPRLAAPAAADGRAVLVGGGTISPESFTLERGFYRATLSTEISDGLPPGPYRAILMDDQGAALYTREFGLIELSNGAPTESGLFQILLPDLPETAAIVFVHGEVELGRVSSSNPPTIRLVTPVGGEDWGDAGAHEIAWEASDPDGDALRFNVQSSADGGATWSSIDFDLAGVSSLSVDSAELPGGNLLFRVLATDGFNVAESATTSAITIGNKAPLIHISSPIEGDAFPAGEMAVFRGYAVDIEDGVVEDSAFRWSSDRDGDLGPGPTLWGLALTPGTHQITLTVADRAGNSVSESVQITIGTEAASTPLRPIGTLAILLLVGGGVLLLGAAAGAFFYLRRARG
ncbi:MAG: Ig-like domain-containing protein [Anaerolineales bacterium]